MTKSTNKANAFAVPDWVCDDLLNAWIDYFKIRKKAGIVVTDRVKKNRIKELEEFRRFKYKTSDLVKVIDNSANANWHKFYSLKGFVMVEEKPVQEREKVINSPEIEEKLKIYKDLCFEKINFRSEIDRVAHQERITKAKKAWQDAIERSSCKKLGDLMPQHTPQNES